LKSLKHCSTSDTFLLQANSQSDYHSKITHDKGQQ